MPVVEVVVVTTRTGLTVSWQPPPCADHFVIRLRHLGGTSHTPLGRPGQQDTSSPPVGTKEVSKAPPTPSWITDDEDYQYKEGSGLGRFILNSTFFIYRDSYSILDITESSFEAAESVDDLEYYGEDFLGMEQDYDFLIGNTSNGREKRSPDEDDIYKLLELEAEAVDVDYDYEMDDDYKEETETSIEDLLELDDSLDLQPPEASISVAAGRWGGEVRGLEPCSHYVLSVLAVYPGQVSVPSQEERVATLCEAEADCGRAEFSLTSDTSRQPPGVFMQISEPAVSACPTSYHIKICLQSACQLSELFNNTNEKIELTSLDGLSPLQPCRDYTVQLLPTAGTAGHTEKHFNFSTEALRPPGKQEVTVEAASKEMLTLNFLLTDSCVTGHDVVLYEWRHLHFSRLHSSSRHVQRENLHKVRQVRLDSNQTTVEIRQKLRPGGIYLAEIRNIHLITGTASEPLEVHFQVPCEDGDDYPEAYSEEEVVVDTQERPDTVTFQFVSRCVRGHLLSLCRWPQDCQAGKVTTYTIPFSEEEHARGHYQYTVRRLLPCSAFRWELVSLPHNVTLYQDLILTGADLSSPSPFIPVNGKVSLSSGKLKQGTKVNRCSARISINN